MSDFTCTYCHTTFIERSALTRHTKTSKKCLEIQCKLNVKVVSQLVPCKYCTKQYDPSTMSRHLLTCKMKTQHQIQYLENQVSKLRTEIQSYEEKIETLQNQLQTQALMYEEQIKSIKDYNIYRGKLTEEHICIDEAEDHTPEKVELSDIADFPIFKRGEARVLGTRNKPLFVAKDIAKLLGYVDAKTAIHDYVKDYNKITYKDAQLKGLYTTFKLQPQTILINKTGVCELILRSTLPKAKSLQSWASSTLKTPCAKVTHDSTPVDNEHRLSLPNGKTVIVIARDDGYVNATILCKNGNKKLTEYKRLRQTQDYLKKMETETGLDASELIQINSRQVVQHTWIHPKLALNLCQWIYPSFTAQMSTFLDNVLVESEVEKDTEVALPEAIYNDVL